MVLCQFPPRSQRRAGRGFATAAVRALIDFGRAVLCATELWAGVTHGNEASIRVLERLGFEFVERLERHTRFHLATRPSRRAEGIGQISLLSRLANPGLVIPIHLRPIPFGDAPGGVDQVENFDKASEVSAGAAPTPVDC